MKKGFTLVEVAAVLGVAFAVALISNSYRTGVVQDERAKLLAKDLYSYNALIGDYLRSKSIEEIRSSVGINEGTDWMGRDIPAMPNGRTRLYSLSPETGIVEISEGNFISRTVWSPIVIDGLLDEALMGKTALYTSSMILTDKSYHRSNQGSTFYCPTSISNDEIRAEELCKGAKGSIVSINSGSPVQVPELEVDIDALSVNHLNTMQAPFVFGNDYESSGSGVEGALPGNINVLPFDEVLSGGQSFYYEERESYDVYHNYDEAWGQYSVNIDGYGGSYYYDRYNDDINISGSLVDGEIYYNKSTRNLTHYSNQYCDGSSIPSGKVEFPFDEEPLSSFELVYEDEWDYKEYQFEDSQGDMHYYMEPWGEYSYWNSATGNSYYRHANFATYYEGDLTYTKNLSTGEITVESNEICEKVYEDVDLIYSPSSFGDIIQGSGVISETRAIGNVARIYNNESALRIGRSQEWDTWDTGFYHLIYSSDDFSRNHTRRGLWFEQSDHHSLIDILHLYWYFVDPDGDKTAGDLIDVGFSDNTAVEGDFRALHHIRSMSLRAEALNVSQDMIAGSISGLAESISADMLGVSGASSFWETPGIITDYLHTPTHYTDDWWEDPTTDTVLQIEDGRALVTANDANDEDWDWWSGLIEVQGLGSNVKVNTLSAPLELDGDGYNHDISIQTRGLSTPFLKGDSVKREVSPPEFSTWNNHGKPITSIDDSEYCFNKVGIYANGDIAICGENYYHKASPGASLWESYTSSMHNYERDWMSRFIQRADNFCKNHYGEGYFHVNHEFGPDFELDWYREPVRDAEGKVTGYRYFVRTSINNRYNYPTCVKEIK